MIGQANCLIFDLDGTLYEDNEHFNYYAELLRDHVSEKDKCNYSEDYTAIVDGKHFLSIGKVYDMEQDTIITVDPFTNQVEKVTSWYGDLWTQQDIEHVYPSTLNYDFDRMIAIGDGWWLPFAVAMHYGVNLEDARKCYVKTKDYMSTDDFIMTKTKGLKSALKRWKEEKLLVLVTNSEEYDAQNILERIELKGVFHETIPSAWKPQHTQKHFSLLVEKYGLNANEVVSIGDNFLNEIAPALKMGMNAVLVQPGSINFEHPNLKVVSSLEDICS